MTEALYEGSWLSLRRRGRWEYATRTRGREVAAVAALTDSDEFLVVEQVRPSLAAAVIELPAGLVGDESGHEREDALAAARRELLEETGYAEGVWSRLHRGPVSAGLSDEVLSIYLAHAVVPRGAGGGVDGEKIIVHRVPLAHARRRLAQWSEAGTWVDPKVLLGLLAIESWLNADDREDRDPSP